MRTLFTLTLSTLLLSAAPAAIAGAEESATGAPEAENEADPTRPPVPRRPPPSFYARMSFGGGGGATRERNDVAVPPIENIIRGGSLGGGASVGTRFGEQLFLHADFWGTSVAGEGNVFQADARLLGAGLGFTYYLMPSRVYFMFAPGIGMAFSKGPSVDYVTTLGMAISGSIGWDWKIGEDWSVGVEAQGRLYWTSDADLYLLSGTGILAFVASYGTP